MGELNFYQEGITTMDQHALNGWWHTPRIEEHSTAGLHNLGLVLASKCYQHFVLKAPIGYRL